MIDNELAQLEFLASEAGRALLAKDWPADPLAAQKKLRKFCTPEQARAVTVLLKIRQKAVQSGKFPADFAADMIATDIMYQQASSMRLGSYVAQKLRAATDKVIELCCGMGADAAAMARAGIEIEGYDISKSAIFASQNNVRAGEMAAKYKFNVVDVTTVDIGSCDIVHIDPDRRPSGKRGVSLDDCSPGGEFLELLMKNTRGGVMKLSPALSWRDLEGWEDVRLEYISEGGVCRQLAGWWGDLVDGVAGAAGEYGADGAVGAAGGAGRRATVVFGDHYSPEHESIDIRPYCYADIRRGGKFLLEPDPAVLAAGGVDALGLKYGYWKQCGGLDWLFSDEPSASRLCRNFEIICRVPGRAGDIKKELGKLGAGTVEVKPRGVVIDTDKMQKKFSGKGKNRLCVLWTRFDDKQVAYIARRQ